jgi:BirA family biotin operon repressor/biotin-[acetyl-CoA-carboxylase] ligase
LSAEHAALRLLRFLSINEPRSGEEIARELGCSRSAVWKQVEALRHLGVGVESMTGRGYWLVEPIELLDADRIERSVGERESAYLNRLEVWPELDSTNAELQRRAPAGQHGLVLFAERQTAGRGRHGRAWFSPLARNLYFSLGWRFELGIGELSALPLVLALAAADALADCGLEGHVIKWPNDLHKDGQKLAGCLVEVQGDASGPCTAVMGVGINVHMPHGTDGCESIDQPWADVARFVPGISRNHLAAALTRCLVSQLLRFERLGFADFLDAWNVRDTLAGKVVDIDSPTGRVRGRVRGVSSRGGLLVETPDEVKELHAGEISLHA